jgi:PAS domain S-box-containing protein
MAPHNRTLVLNVDDDDTGRYAVTRMLELNNFLVKEAANGAEALRMAASEQPDVILLDVNLPDIDGFDVCRRLKATPATARIPVLHITASLVQGAEMARGLEAGAESYLTEPVEPEVLVATINSVLRARRAEEAAREMAMEWQATFDAINDGVAVADAVGAIQRCNRRFAELVGRPAEELAGVACQSLWERAPGGKAPFSRVLESGRRETVDLEYQGKLLRVTVDPMPGAGKTSGAVFTVSDITETRRLEDQFRESQKFETVGTLAAGVAHDYNNLLTSIMGNASLALGSETIGEDVRDSLQEVVRASQRAADLTKQLLAYAGKARHYMQKLELSAQVREIEKLIQAAVPKKVRVELRLATDLPAIQADPSQVQQLLLNLVSNAAEAIGEESGTIAISTGAEGGGEIFLEVRDTGCGMDPETRGRMFDPFFSTKFTGRGLGLAAVAGIARGHKASIEVNSAPGQGTVVRVSFPRAERPAAAAGAVGARAAAATVLVVDDEEMVRRIARAALEMRGHRVLVAGNGLEAIAEVQAHPEISVVLLDLTMPVMGGEEAVDGILEARPGLKVVISTGYDSRIAQARFSHKNVAGYLQKPYTSRQLTEKISAVLEGQEG